MSAAPLSVNQALAKVMAELPAIGKERHNGDGNERGVQYAYRGIEQVTREVQGLFAKHGVVIVPAVQSIEVKDITVNNKPWTDTQLVVNYTLVGPDGSQLQATTCGIGRDNSDKGANKAMTQAFKYLLLQVLCISDAKDDGDAQTHEADARAPRALKTAARREAEAVYDRLLALDLPGRDAFKAHAAGRKYSADALEADADWREEVSNWLDERAHNQQAEQEALPV